jgi:2-isopropylmalate synthase
MGEVAVTVDFDGDEIHGLGTSTDIIEASALAYMAAVNRAVARSRRAKRPAGAKRGKGSRRPGKRAKRGR